MTHKKLLLLGALALFAFAAGCSSDECSSNTDCADRGANFVCANSTCVQKTPVDAGVSCSPECSGDTPICDQGSLTCVQCTQNSECSGATPACDTATNTCVACTSDAQCGGDTPACDTTTNTCLACVGNGDCTDAAAPVCDTTAHACVACLTNDNCQDASAPTCDTSTNTCVGCTGNADCAGNANGEICDTSAQVCVGCLGNGDCGGTTPTCDTTSHTCTASCAVDGDCASTPSTPVCNTTTNLCVECDSTHACTTGVCDTGTDTCVECVGNTDCAANPNGGACDIGTHTCGCTVAADCAATSGTPTCDTNAHLCVASCSTDSDCSADLSSDCVDGGQGKLCADVDVAAASMAIDAIRSAAIAGTTTSTQAVSGAIVTYLKPSVGGDPAGFFVQAEASGPGLLVAVDPATLSPVPAVGDRVAFTADTLDTLGGLPEVTALAAGSWDVISTGHDASLVKTDVSAATDLVSALDTYDSRLISLDFTVAADPGYAGNGALGAQITTTGIGTASNSFKLYAPQSVFADKDIVNTCVGSITNGIMFRFNATAEPGIWNDADVTLTSCPAPTVVSAGRNSLTEVVVTFDRTIDPASISAGAFTIAETANFGNTLAVSAAVAGADAHQVVLTTATQTAGTQYTVLVASTVKDTLGASLGSPNSATFFGYAPPATLRITEINPNTSATNGGDTVELKATVGGALDGFLLKEGAFNATLITFPSGVVVATGDVIRIHLGSGLCNEDKSSGLAGCVAGDAGNKTQWYSDTQWDFSGGTGLAASSTFRIPEIIDPSGNVMDAVPCHNPGKTDTAGISVINDLQTAGLWAPATLCTDFTSCSAIAVDWTGTASDGTTSIQRSTLTLPGDKSQWSAPATQTYGTAP